ncbi:MAG: D-alanyl-D-alanine carboxypeptidase [Clostridia bacterium]|nr:D-alanyl-D-alanine carboxypeptidase [Clostridia bacterium]
MKKLYAAILSLIIVAVMAVPCRAAEGSCPIDLSGASAAILINTDTGTVIFEKNSTQPVEVAGLKRLPALLAICSAFDNGLINMDTDVLVSPEAAAIRGATAFLSPNEHIKAGELLKAAVILAPGDAIYSLLHTVYPGEASALEAVNGLLSELGASSVSESMGTEAELSLEALSKVCVRLSSSEAFLKYSSVYLDTLPHENASATELTNPNRLVRHYSGCFGMATGSVGSSEYSGAFIARRGNTTFLAIVAGLNDSASRFKLGSDMLDYGFAAYRLVEIGKEGESAGSVPVNGGTIGSVEAVTKGNVTALMPVNDAKVISNAELPESMDAPIEEGAVLGSLKLTDSSGKLIGEVPLVAVQSVESTSFWDCFIKVLLQWLKAV